MTQPPCTIQIERAYSAEDAAVVQAGLRAYNEARVPSTDDIRFAVFLRGPDGAVTGGVLAQAGRGWLRIGTMWVDETVRGHGYGAQLLAAAEDVGRRHGCHSAFLDTFSFQAPAFYARCGYELFATLDDFPDGHQRHFMRKRLR